MFEFFITMDSLNTRDEDSETMACHYTLAQQKARCFQPGSYDNWLCYSIFLSLTAMILGRSPKYGARRSALTLLATTLTSNKHDLELNLRLHPKTVLPVTWSNWDFFRSRKFEIPAWVSYETLSWFLKCYFLFELEAFITETKF